MATDAQTSLTESELLLLLEMCREGIEKCDARAQKHDLHSQAAEWDRRLRERYAHLLNEVLAELEQRQRAVGGLKPETGRPQGTSKSRSKPPAQ